MVDCVVRPVKCCHEARHSSGPGWCHCSYRTSRSYPSPEISIALSDFRNTLKSWVGHESTEALGTWGLFRLSGILTSGAESEPWSDLSHRNDSLGLCSSLIGLTSLKLAHFSKTGSTCLTTGYHVFPTIFSIIKFWGC